VRQRSFTLLFSTKTFGNTSICQDRLGTNIGKVRLNEDVSAGVGLNFTALDKAMDQLHAAGLYPGFEIMGNPGKETPLFAVPFISKMHHFTKTGSGQT
jgi:hypothetical protein